MLAAARLVSRVGLAAVLVLAMLFGLRPEPPALEVAADGNDHATQQHPSPTDAHELIAEAEESRDELEEHPEVSVALLCGADPAVVCVRAVVVGATHWIGRARLSGPCGLGRGPPARA